MSDRESVILGSLLGDASISRPRTPRANCSWSKKQARRRREYLEWTRNVIGCGWLTDVQQASVVGGPKKYPATVLETPRSKEFTDLRTKWYPSGVKQVPRDLVLTPLMVAIWFFDDGSHDADNMMLRFHTNGFSEDDRECLVAALLQLGIRATVGGEQKVLCVRRESYADTLDLVEPFCLWDCFRYKVTRHVDQRQYTKLTATEREVIYANEDDSLTELAAKTNRSTSTVSNALRKNSGRTLARNNTTGVKGLYWDANRKVWAAYKRVNRKQVFLGRFADRDEAIGAIQRATT